MTSEQDMLFPFNGSLNLMLLSVSVILMAFLGTSEMTEDLGIWYAVMGILAFALILFSFSGNQYDSRMKTLPTSLPLYIFIIGIGGSVTFAFIFRTVFNSHLSQKLAPNVLTMLILVFIEEAMFRIALPRFLLFILNLEAKLSSWLIVIGISNLFFGVFHAIAYNLDFDKIILAAIGGGILSLSYFILRGMDTRGEYVLTGLGLSHFLHNWSLINQGEAITLTLTFMLIIYLLITVRLQVNR